MFGFFKALTGEAAANRARAAQEQSLKIAQLIAANDDQQEFKYARAYYDAEDETTTA